MTKSAAKNQTVRQNDTKEKSNKDDESVTVEDEGDSLLLATKQWEE